MSARHEPSVLDLFQVLALVVAGWLGVVPLGQHLLGARQGGLYNVVFGQLGTTGAAAVVVPVVVVIAMFGVVAGLDVLKKRRLG